VSGQIDLPAIGVEVVVNDSALARTGAAARTTGKQIESGLGPGSKSTAELTSGLEGLAAQFGISLPPEVKKSASALLSLVSGSSTTKANISGLSQGAKALATDLGISLPPQAEKTIAALSGLSSTSSMTAAEVGALSAGSKGLASDLGAGVPVQAEKSATALKGLASSGTAANAVVGLTSGAVVIVEEDLARAGNTATGTGEKIQSALETGKKASEALKTGLEGVGKGGDAAAAGGEAAAAGVGALTGAAIAGVAALTAVVVTGKSIEDSYVSIAEKVENYRRVTGASAEDSSREVQVFEELGVSADTASQAVYRFSKTVESTPDKLRALGIEIGHDNTGQVDLNKTLLNAADAYVNAGSALQKDTILQTAFGKSGRDMIPILEQGSAGLQQLERSVSLVFTDADLERVKQMKIHTEEIKSEWQQFMDQAGRPMTELFNNLGDAELASNYANQKYQEGLDNGTIKTEVSGVALGKLLDKYEKEFYANQKAAEGITSASQAMQAQADAARKLTDALDASISAIEGEASAEQALLNANIDAKESQDKITEAQIRARDANRQVAAAQAAYNLAVREHGKNSAEAQAALDALTQAQINARTAVDDVSKAQEGQYMAYIKAAEAAQKLQMEQDKANDVTGLQAHKLETEKLIDTLQAEADSLAPGSPLRKHLQEYIDMLKSKVPADVSTRYLIEYKAVFDAPGGRSGTAHYASGGRPPLDKVSEVGEQGVEIFTPDEPDRPQLLIGTKGPQMFVPPEPGIITPHGAEPPLRAGSVFATSPEGAKGEAPLAASLPTQSLRTGTRGPELFVPKTPGTIAPHDALRLPATRPRGVAAASAQHIAPLSVGESGAARARMPTASTEWGTSAAAAFTASSEVLDALHDIKAILDRPSSSEGLPQMAHVTVDQPIVLDDQVIGRIVDRRIAKFSRAGMSGT
jgi:hypothetical protein